MEDRKNIKDLNNKTSESFGDFLRIGHFYLISQIPLNGNRKSEE